MMKVNTSLKLKKDEKHIIHIFSKTFNNLKEKRLHVKQGGADKTPLMWKCLSNRELLKYSWPGCEK